MCFILKKDKQKALSLLKQKINDEIKITYKEIANISNYSLPQIKRLSQEVEKKDIEKLLVHGLTGKNSNNSAPQQEIEYIKEFKNQYTVISISQFMDIYHEDVIWNAKKHYDVKKYNLKVRSKSFFQQLKFLFKQSSPLFVINIIIKKYHFKKILTLINTIFT